MSEQILNLDHHKERQLQDACSFAYIGLWINHFAKHDNIILMPTRNPHIKRMDFSLWYHITGINIDKFVQEHVLSEKEYAAWNAHQWADWLIDNSSTGNEGKTE
jgi:hypothetical protein